MRICQGCLGQSPPAVPGIPGSGAWLLAPWYCLYHNTSTCVAPAGACRLTHVLYVAAWNSLHFRVASGSLTT
jgi:hypothetical protein